MKPKDGTTEESPRETEIRYMDDLLQELRVILPGVQVTFAFLLTVAFMDRFAQAVAWAKRLLCGATVDGVGNSLLYSADHPASHLVASGRESYEAEGRQWPFNSGYGSACDRDELRIFLVADVVYGRTGAIVAT